MSTDREAVADAVADTAVSSLLEREVLIVLVRRIIKWHSHSDSLNSLSRALLPLYKHRHGTYIGQYLLPPNRLCDCVLMLKHT